MNNVKLSPEATTASDSVSSKATLEVVHDLRSALTTMVSSLRIIERLSEDHAEIQEMAKMGLRGGDQLSEMIATASGLLRNDSSSSDHTRAALRTAGASR